MDRGVALRLCLFFIILFATIVNVAANAENSDREAALQRQLDETNRQKTSNQRLMLDAAVETAETFEGIATSRGDPSSAKRVIRLTEIASEIRTAARRDDAISAGRLMAEAGQLIVLEVLTRANDTARTTAGVVGTILSVPRAILPAARAYRRFVEGSIQDARLLRREVDLSRQLAELPVSTSRETRTPVEPRRGKQHPPRSTTVSREDAQSLTVDGAFLLTRWLDLGNRAFATDSEEHDFYKRFPSLVRYRDVAEYRSPASEFDDEPGNVQRLAGRDPSCDKLAAAFSGTWAATSASGTRLLVKIGTDTDGAATVELEFLSLSGQDEPHLELDNTPSQWAMSLSESFGQGTVAEWNAFARDQKQPQQQHKCGNQTYTSRTQFLVPPPRGSTSMFERATYTTIDFRPDVPTLTHSSTLWGASQARAKLTFLLRKQ